MINQKDIYPEEQKRDNEVLQKQIDLVKLSIEIDMHAHSGAYNTLLQNVSTRLVYFLGFLGIINLLILYYYFTFFDAIHFILINLCLILFFYISITTYVSKERLKKEGINHIEKDFGEKMKFVKELYKEMKFGSKSDNFEKVLKLI